MSPDTGMVMGMMEQLEAKSNARIRAMVKAAGRSLKGTLHRLSYGALRHSGHATLISQVHPEQQDQAEHIEPKEFSPRKRLFPWTGDAIRVFRPRERLHCVDEGRDSSVSSTTRLHFVAKELL